MDNDSRIVDELLDTPIDNQSLVNPSALNQEYERVKS
jgi:hypothetical protein